MTEYWEPRTFNVGDRVRIRLSGECRRKASPGSWCDEHRITHLPYTDGIFGIVIPLRKYAKSKSFDEDIRLQVEQGHTVNVEFCEPQEWQGWPILADFFAAAELEPVTE